jgi:hypothetical protein
MATINDRRKDKTDSFAFVVFTDKFMSGWGGAANGRSLYALPVSNWDESARVIASGKRRSEMKRPRILRSYKALLRSVRRGDHLAIADRSEASRWYEPDGFGEGK